MLKMNKHAEITSTTIIGLILLIVGFGILVFFLYQLNFNGQVDKEVCHESVIMRGTLPSTVGAKSYVPLKCRTEKICVTSNAGGSCSEFQNTKGITTVKVTDRTQLEKFLAQNIVDCWSMMGEGKVSIFSNYLSEYGIATVYPSCIICSRVAFNNTNLAKIGIDLKTIDVLQYMRTHYIADKKVTYSEYLSGGNSGVNVKGNLAIPDIADSNGNLVEKPQPPTSFEEPTKEDLNAVPDIVSKEWAVTFMQISTPRYKDVLSKTAGTLGIGWGASAVLAPTIVGKATIGALKSPWTLAIIAIAGGIQYGTTRWNQAVTVNYCGDVKVGDAARETCSVVRLTNYNSQDISQYCSVIESIS